MGKSIFYSKTIWVFLILLVVSVLNQLGITNLPLSQDASWVGIVLSVVALFLRLITKGPINWE